MQKNQKLSITGASGFLGRNLLHILRTGNYQISVLNMSSAAFPKDIKVVRGNLLTGKNLDEFLERSDILIHLAGQVLPGETSMEMGNTKTTENLLSIANNHKIKKIIFSSTVAVYGSSGNKIFEESDECNPDTEYGISKLNAEKIIKKWGSKTGNQYAILRFFSLYGPGNKKGLVYNLCNDFISKGEITVYGEGSQKRDLIWVEDAAKALLLAVEQPLKGIYNIGTGNNYSVLDIISILEKVSGKECKIVFEKQDKSKVSDIFYKSERIKNETGWAPEIMVEEGIKRVYQSLLNPL